ncbi:hypothetical protein HK102_005989 [Quaeritorhiza haematococci]|nr:hypothetical protein HK102_005989 [Quaeritorhiza haematococci]
MASRATTTTTQPNASIATLNEVDEYGFPKVPFRGHYTREKVDARRKWVEHFTGAKLSQVGEWWGNEGEDHSCSVSSLKHNIENPIGLVKVPVGIAGPLHIRGTEVNGVVLLPMATTEGALVASVTRGATVINRAGGVTCIASEQKMIRAPFFTCEDPIHAHKLRKYITEDLGAELIQREVVAKHSKHGKLIALEPHVLGCTVHVRFIYLTGDAAGQNMTTTTTWESCKFILNKVANERPDIQITNFAVEGQMAGDKKLTTLNHIHTRGLRVTADVKIPDEVLRSVLKCDSLTYLRMLNTARAGAAAAGMASFNINVANVIAAVFTAAGQDIACVHESAIADLHYDYIEPCDQYPTGGIHLSMDLPCLVIGTVGGGTSLATQRECLEIMGCYGRGKVKRLGEIIAGFCLALDISTSAAVCTHVFARSHERLGRNRPQTGFKPEYLNSEFFRQVLNGMAVDGDQLELVSYQDIKMDSSSSILSELTNGENTKLVGHYAFDLKFKPKHSPASSATESRKTVLKIKGTDAETIHAINKMTNICGPSLAQAHEMFKFRTGFKNCHTRELAIINHTNDPRFARITPKVYHTWLDLRKEIFMYSMEFLDESSDEVLLMNSADHAPDQWTPEFVRVALRDIAGFHSIHLHEGTNLPESLKALKPVLEIQTADRMTDMAPLWRALLSHNASEFPGIFTPDRVQKAEKIIAALPAIWRHFEGTADMMTSKGQHSKPLRTLNHGDFNPRNICLRRLPTHNTTTTSSSTSSSTLALCAYDWELATIHVPQRDIAEFLCFTMDPQRDSPNNWHSHVEFYRRELIRAAFPSTPSTPSENNDSDNDDAIPFESFHRTFDLAVADYLVTRILMYGVTHTFKDSAFFERIVEAAFGYLDAQGVWYLDVFQNSRGVTNAKQKEKGKDSEGEGEGERSTRVTGVGSNLKVRSTSRIRTENSLRDVPAVSYAFRAKL